MSETATEHSVGRSLLDKVETIYLKALRIIILLSATLLIAYAAYLATNSIIKISRSVDSVKEAPAGVSAEELLKAAAKTSPSQAGSESAQIEERRFYDAFVKRYHQLFAQRFEPFRQTDDKILTATEFGDAFVNTPERLAAIKRGELDFAKDRSDLELLLKTIADAAAKPATIQALTTYKRAVKVNSCENVTRTRTTYRSGWDRYSTSCSDWYETPMGCPASRPVQVDYVERVCTMKFAKGIRSHTDILRDYQDRFFALLYQRRADNGATAQSQREEIVAGNAQGKVGLMTAIYFVAGFVMLMFFFLLIAIERHQRKRAAE